MSLYGATVGDAALHAAAFFCGAVFSVLLAYVFKDWINTKPGQLGAWMAYMAIAAAPGMARWISTLSLTAHGPTRSIVMRHLFIILTPDAIPPSKLAADTEASFRSDTTLSERSLIWHRICVSIAIATCSGDHTSSMDLGGPMASIPRDRQLDSTLALLSEGYTFISKRCRRYGSDIFETRLMLRKAICMMGEEAASVFYHADRFTRVEAMPKTALRLLQDTGSVALLDGQAHQWRKQMFMSLMTPGGIQELSKIAAEQWHAAMSRWETQDQVVFLPEVQEVLCRAVCRWTGVPLSDSEGKQRTREVAAMIDGSGAIGPRNWRGLLLRARTERWLQSVIEQARARPSEVVDIDALHLIAWHRTPEGKLLDSKVAAVELLNVLRPTVPWPFIFFAALCLSPLHGASRNWRLVMMRT